MGWTFHPTDSLPEPGDIVWCKFPVVERPGQPGPIVRPTLTRATSILQSPDGVTFGAVEVSYGTGEYDDSHRGIDLIIEPMRRARELGLHKPTRFSLNPRSRKNLIWCEEFFVAPSYLVGQGIVCGSLGPDEIAQIKECLRNRAGR